MKPSLYKDVRNIPVADIFKALVDNRENIFYPWSSIANVSNIAFIYILIQNDIKCNILSFQKGEKNILSSQCETKEEKKLGICDNNIWLKDNAENIAEKYKQCFKDKEPLYIPMKLKTKVGTHANSLLLNPYLNTAEHFEPHGDKFKGSGILGSNDFKKGIDEINKYLGDKLKLKYVPTNEVCPSPNNFKKLKGYQSGDTKDSDLAKNPRRKPTLFEGVLITEIGGYCRLWNLFHFDLRLKTLKRPSGEVYREMIKLFNEESEKTNQRFIELTRGMSKYVWKQLENALKPKFNNTSPPITREELIKYLDVGHRSISKDPDMNRVWSVLDNMTKKILEEKFNL